MMSNIFILHNHHVCLQKCEINLKTTAFFSITATRQQNSSRSSFNNSNNAEYTQIYNQAVLLNSLLRNMVKESVIQNSSSNESCSSNNTQVKKVDDSIFMKQLEIILVYKFKSKRK